ncbi:hypothetical protein GCM10027422_47380 [Hymenobacter arcticus]
MPTTPENQPQSAKKKLETSSVFLIKTLSQALKDTKFNGIPLLAIIILAAFIKIFTLIKPGIPDILKQAKLEDILVLAGSVLITIFILIVNYLDNNQSKFDEKVKELIRETEQAVVSRQNEAIKAISNLKGIKNEYTHATIEEKESVLIEEELIKIYEKFIKDESYNDKIKSIKKKAKANVSYQKIDDAIERLKKEIEQLSRRANINLGIGSTVTIAALSSLSYFIVHENFNSPDIKLALFHFVPRLSLVIFIEFFSFFFLKLYRANLHEIKYYQNELTNLEVKAVAIELAVKNGSKDDVSILIKDMSLVERNFKLQKGESTVELERSKAETHDLKEVLKVLIGTYKKDK